MDLKQAIDEVQRNPTFKCILGTLLSVGNFLNGTKVGFNTMCDFGCEGVVRRAIFRLAIVILAYAVTPG